MNGTVLPKFYENHTPPKEYYELPDPTKSYTPTASYNIIKLVKYAKSVGKIPNELTWDELQQFRV